MLLFYEDEPGSVELKSAEPNITMGTSTAQQIDPLRHYGSYAFIPYHNHTENGGVPTSTSFSPSHLTNIKALKVYNTSSWTYSGSLLPACSKSLPASFHAWSSLTVSDPSTLLHRLLPLLSFLQNYLSDAGVHCYWLTIRASKPTKEYDERRWHVDDDFFSPDFDGRAMQAPAPRNQSNRKSSERWKVCATLLGPSTVFLTDNDSALKTLRDTKAKQRISHQHTCTSIRCLGCSTYADSVRHSLSHSLSAFPTTSPAPKEVAFFRLGSRHGAVHSEPTCDVDRIFVNVVPGSDEELKGLLAKWGLEWPRAWCFGVPGGAVGSDEREALAKMRDEEVKEREERGRQG
jgi:hypothetical protein